MGHRLSKSVSSVVNHQQQRPKSSQNHHTQRESSSISHHSRNQFQNDLILSNHQNLNNQHQSGSIEIDAIPSTSSSSSLATISPGQNLRLESATLTVPAQVTAIAPRRFIIKIQLTKMEPGDANDDTTTLSTTVAVESNGDETTVVDSLDNNLNITKPVLNLTFTKNISCDGLLNDDGDHHHHHHHHIVIENGNETIQLNNLNATSATATVGAAAATTTTTTATINSNFVDNFAAVMPSSSSSQQFQQLLDSEGNNLAGHLNNLNLTTRNGFTHSNIINSSDSLSNSCCNSNNSMSPNTSDINNLNCINNNNNPSSNGDESYNTTQTTIVNNSICNQNQNDECVNGGGGGGGGSLDVNQRIFSGSTMCSSNHEDKKSHCCQKKKSSAYPTKWRCCKCSCRDSVKLSNTSSSTTPNNNNGGNGSKDLTTTKSSSTKSSWTSKFNCTKKDNNTSTESKQQNTNSNTFLSPVASSSESSSPISSSSSSSTSAQQQQQQQQWIPSNTFNFTATPASSQSTTPSTSSQQNRTCPRSDHLTMWEPILPLTPFIDHHHHHHHHIQTIARCPGGPHNLFVFSVNHPASPQQSSQIVFGQIEDLDERARRLRALEIETGLDPLPSELESALANVLSPQNPWHHIMCAPSNFGTVVHSQVDYIHCLVPDLEKITSSSFYWGKMDRYEAERLLEGKPEGTFLLRDSAQEEYLFSVTFRKYGRSLHARIEQFNHKFSFDGHDPGVFTASTVTGLLEHYKDPSCVMFFEPMLTIPLHRNFTFSLQQLCRATIVSNITYDGINELHLPNSLKSYLKEYHYKLRVRVKPFDEPFYTCS